MYLLSARAQTAVRSSHVFTVRATVYSAVLGVYPDLPISGGTVTSDSTSQTRGSASIIVDPAFWPADPFDLLSPAGSEIQIDYGVEIPGADTEWIPMIRGMISQAQDTVPATSSTGLTVPLVDRSQRIKDDRLEAPMQVTSATGTVVQAIESLITSTYPDAVIIDQTGDTTVCPTLTIQQDKWGSGVEVLATAIGAECFPDRLGRFVIRAQPTLLDPVTWLVNTGPAGNLSQNQRTRTRDNTFNKVVVLSAASDGTATVLASVTDDDPTSPTFYDGPFGRKPRFYSSPTITSPDQALVVAKALLARATGMDTQVALQVVANPGQDSGDVIQLDGSTGTARHICDTVVTPLDTQSAQQLTARGIALPAEQMEALS